MAKSPESQNQENCLIQNEQVPKVESYAVGGVLKELQQKLKPALQYIAFLAAMSAVDVSAGGYVRPAPETGKTKYSLVWDPVNCATYYNVLHSLNGGNTWEPPAKTTETIYDIPTDKYFGTQGEAPVTWTIQAGNSYGESPNSNLLYTEVREGSNCVYEEDEMTCATDIQDNELCSDGLPPTAKGVIEFSDGKKQILYECRDEKNCSLTCNSKTTLPEDDQLVENATDELPPEDPVTSEIPNATEDLPPDDFLETFVVWENATNEEPPPDF